MFKLLRRYTHFPANVHGVARFTYVSSTQMLQMAIARVLHRLNKRTIDMKTLTRASQKNCMVNFEFGIADAETFNFLDEGELRKLESILKDRALQILDVFCAARYHVKKADGTFKSLKFDYNLLRFVFQRKNMELFIYHERGIRRIPMDDVVLFLINEINEKLVENHQGPLIQKHIHIL